METINERILKIRKECGLSQDAFAERIGVTKSAISGYEIGRREPTLQIIKSICREFGVDTECLSTSVTILVAMVGFMIIYIITRPMKRHHWLMLGGVFAGWLFCMLFISHWFAITSINTQCAMLMVLFALATEPLMRYLTMFFSWILDRIDEKAKKENAF